MNSHPENIYNQMSADLRKCTNEEVAEFLEEMERRYLDLFLTPNEINLLLNYVLEDYLSDEKLHYMFITAQKNCVEIMVNSHFAGEHIIKIPYTDDYPFSHMVKHVTYNLHGLYSL